MNQGPLILDAATALAQERDLLGLHKDSPASALCLSGGGIRSAAFCLGVLQSLAAHKVLHGFSYLSTVSGGGYIGSWLTRALALPERRGQPLARTLEELLVARDGHDPVEIAHLRRYTSFLTPQPGLATSDTLAGGILWLRNTLINWLVFAPVMLAIAALPVAYISLACALAALRRSGIPPLALPLTIGIVGLVCLSIAIRGSCLGLPTHSHADTAGTPADLTARSNGRSGMPPGQIRRGILRPAWIWAFLAPLAIAVMLDPPDLHRGLQGLLIHPPAVACKDLLKPAVGPVADLSPAMDRTPDCRAPTAWRPRRRVSPWILAALPAGSWVACMTGFCLAWARLRSSFTDASGGASNAAKKDFLDKHDQAFRRNAVAFGVSAVLMAGLLGLGIVLLRKASMLWLATLGPGWAIVSDMLRTTLYLALRQDGLRADLDREWLARLNADKLRVVFVSTLASVATLCLPILVMDQGHQTWAKATALVALFTSGPIAAWLGKSASTAFAPVTASETAPPWKQPQVLVSVAVAIFATTLLMLFGRVATLASLGGATTLLRVGKSAPWWPYLALCLIASAIAAACVLNTRLVDRLVNLNRFSLHAVYRNRLVRAFLGSARRDDRRPDAYTGFDSGDDLRMADLLDVVKANRALFPVINVALNDTSGRDTARAERKATSFTITPLHCGAGSLLAPPLPMLDQTSGDLPPVRALSPARRSGGYVSTVLYAGSERESGPDDPARGISLGTAMTISGAAVSPNMGYQSSKAAAFVMTLFNVRLGAWLANTNLREPTPEARAGVIDRLRQSGPRPAVATLLNDLLGRSDDSSDFVYLSDGGHFDNLGLYEMLRRRCAQILVVDAGRDQDYAYGDLGHTLQRALIDQGVSVKFVQGIKVGNGALKPTGAYADIIYAPSTPAGSATGGRLIYLKPWLPDTAPTELQAFKAMKGSFPHETTTDQFFTESDFESYRMLGSWLADTLLNDAESGAASDKTFSLTALFDAVEAMVKRPPPDRDTENDEA